MTNSRVAAEEDAPCGDLVAGGGEAEGTEGSKVEVRDDLFKQFYWEV